MSRMGILVYERMVSLDRRYHTMGRIDLDTQAELEKYIDRDLLTDTSRVHTIWDESGQYVDLEYDYNPETETVDNYSGVFAELYEDGNPNENSWKDAKDIGRYLSIVLKLPLIIERKISNGWGI